jgi:hypothetical protein
MPGKVRQARHALLQSLQEIAVGRIRERVADGQIGHVAPGAQLDGDVVGQ